MSVRYRKMILFAVVAGAIAAWASTVLAASEYVVVEVDPPAEVPPLGKLYRLGDLLHINQGTTVTLMGDDGSVTALPGPADIVITDDALAAGTTSSETVERSSRMSALSELLTNAGGQIQSIGASRSISGIPPTLLEPWAIPLEDASKGCIHNQQLELWREPAGTAGVSIVYDDKPFVAGLVWDDGIAKLVVPGTVPADAGSVGVRIDGQAFRIMIEHLPASVSSDDHVGLYTWMIGSGCLPQASTLIRQLANDNDSR